MNQLISNERKKRFIIDNSNILNKDCKLNIINIVMMEVGTSVIMETNNKKDLDIDLDLLESKNSNTLTHIYNIVKNRLELLNVPIKDNILY
jgi:hypothetical protein